MKAQVVLLTLILAIAGLTGTSYAHKYHFDYDPETNELNLYDSELRQKVDYNPS